MEDRGWNLGLTSRASSIFSAAITICRLSVCLWTKIKQNQTSAQQQNPHLWIALTNVALDQAVQDLSKIIVATRLPLSPKDSLRSRVPFLAQVQCLLCLTLSGCCEEAPTSSPETLGEKCKWGGGGYYFIFTFGGHGIGGRVRGFVCFAFRKAKVTKVKSVWHIICPLLLYNCCRHAR